MDHKSDALLRKILKNWANWQNPPANGRARLLWEAANTSHNKIDLPVILLRPQFKTHSTSSDWSQTFFSWVNENSIQLRTQARMI